MSTFKGFVEGKISKGAAADVHTLSYFAEFPDIRIDYFRKIPKKELPLAAFLSHVHSDHLHGLESFRAPFIYCSSITRELLLGLEKYPHRMNFAKGILESRKQHYRHLKSLLKPIPLNVPTTIELKPGRSIRITLLDANHCPGAVMFLIEDNSHSILYTGDIRAEPWWKDALIRNPVVIPYAFGSRTLDKIYLDTTYASTNAVHYKFPCKAAGIDQLLKQVMRYPKDTVFHLNPWTFGYEDVWIALSSALNSQIHVDEYKFGLFKALACSTADTRSGVEASALSGFICGNHRHPGCLTLDSSVRLHSCEPGTGCPAATSSTTVHIIPMINRSQDGQILPELGAGGGGGDLDQGSDYLELSAASSGEKLIELCQKYILDSRKRSKAVERVQTAINSTSKVLPLQELRAVLQRNEISLKELTMLLSRSLDSGLRPRTTPDSPLATFTAQGISSHLPHQITFPYSRHSSYEELCEFVKAFQPLDVYPCVVDEDQWTWDVSMNVLFGAQCSGTRFAHDEEMARVRKSQESSLPDNKGMPSDCHTTQDSFDTGNESPNEVSEKSLGHRGEQATPSGRSNPSLHEFSSPTLEQQSSSEKASASVEKAVKMRLKVQEIQDLFESAYRRARDESSRVIDGATLSDQTPTHQTDKQNSSERNSNQESQVLAASLDAQQRQTKIISKDEHNGKDVQGNEESQITLSDAAFESQTYTHLSEDNSDNGRDARRRASTRLRRRKSAYRAVRAGGEGWRRTQEMLSVGMDHGAEELEL